jgi:hypothetical protein
LNDAIACCEYAADDAMIFFHDLVFPDVARGFLYFLSQPGWNTRSEFTNASLTSPVYHTQQMMGVAWRGCVSPPEHQPDPRYEWQIPQHLTEFFKMDGSRF